MHKNCDYLEEQSSKKEKEGQWKLPSKVMQMYQLKLKQKQLKARITRSENVPASSSSENMCFLQSQNSESVKRKNPFLSKSQSKRERNESLISELETSADQTLFKLINKTSSEKDKSRPTFTSFTSAFNETKVVPKEEGKPWIPVDWCLKSKVRFISSKPFQWNHKLKISEEASGITSFVRCVENDSDITLDISPNAKFHRCCLYWQQPVLPWLKLFPRVAGKLSATGTSIATTPAVRDALQSTWSDSIRSLFQLIRTRQCPYFYVCANNFTILFRAAGMCGYSELHVIVTPTTRGFRQLLKQEDIEFRMPLKPKKRNSDQGYETQDSTSVQDENLDCEDDQAQEEDDGHDGEDWLLSLGLKTEDIKQITDKQQKNMLTNECKVDNSEQSLIIIKGIEVNAFFNFLINCKSSIATTGTLAGIPPTLLAPVAFNGATLCSLKVRERKVHFENVDYYSLELNGPILPHTIHNLCEIYPKEQSFTATFANLNSTLPFSKITGTTLWDSQEESSGGSSVFGQVNLADCGLNSKILKQFCSNDSTHFVSMEYLKYVGDSKGYIWS